MLIKKTLLTLMALFMAASGMPVYAEQAPEPEVAETDKKLVPETGTASTLGVKKLDAEEPGTLVTGEEFNAAIKTLAAGASTSYENPDSQIQSIQVAKAPPSEGVTTKDVSAKTDGSYLAWWDAGTSTIYLYSKSGDIVLNPDSSLMFYNCSSLTTMDVSKWNTSSVTNMSGMFSYCRNLNALNVSKWNTSSVTDMGGVFNNCTNLATLNVSNWNTSQVTNMSSMFLYCSNLTTLNVAGWNTDSVTDMSYIFQSCYNLTTLDLSEWDTGNVRNMSGMFNGCTKLTRIYIGSGWNTDKVMLSFDMFWDCGNLPNFDPSVVDKTSAHAGSDGYMTLKS